MFKDHAWLNNSDDLHFELLQGSDEGKDTGTFEEIVKKIQTMDPNDPQREKLAAVVFDEISKLPVTDGYKYNEPSEFELIKAARPVLGKNIKPVSIDTPDAVIFDKIYGAWLGRCSGCLLGKPVENWHRERIIRLLRDTGNYPINSYMSSNLKDEILDRYDMKAETYGNRYWINKWDHVPEDDDTNYVLIGLKILETYGKNFTSENVAETWLNSLPVMNVATSERIAYRNLVSLIMPPLSASTRNPYREWIGAQIRADFFGYINPGNPVAAAEMAFRDASISHIKNGIYGEIFIAAILAKAFVHNDIEGLIRTGMSQIPEKSRLYEAICTVLDWKKEGITWEEAIDRVHRKFNEKNMHEWCHTVTNAMVVSISLLFGKLDFEKSIGIAVAAGFDTDCNGATVGSIVGMVLGAKALPEKWIKPLNNKLDSGVRGFGTTEISELAERTVKIIKSL